jgi:hypothetical protein
MKFFGIFIFILLTSCSNYEVKYQKILDENKQLKNMILKLNEEIKYKEDKTIYLIEQISENNDIIFTMPYHKLQDAINMRVVENDYKKKNKFLKRQGKLYQKFLDENEQLKHKILLLTATLLQIC